MVCFKYVKIGSLKFLFMFLFLMQRNRIQTSRKSPLMTGMTYTPHSCPIKAMAHMKTPPTFLAAWAHLVTNINPTQMTSFLDPIPSQ